MTLAKGFKILGFVLAAPIVVLLVLLVGLIVLMWIADPAVPRNLLFGQPIGQPAAVERSQPQVLVPGASGTALSRGEANFDAAALQVAIDYAEQTESLALLIYQGGALRYERYWSGFDRDTRTNPNSMHKPVLALLVGAAIADGYIESVDTPAARWLPEWQDEARGRITLRQLLQMSSGLEIPVFGTWKSAKILFGSDLLAGVISLQAEQTPGTEYQYSNASSQLLAIIVERATGMPYAQYLSRRLWQPLGAGDAGLWLDREGGLPRGFCCLFATAEDWLRVGKLILDRGQVDGRELIPAEWIAAMLTPSPLNPNFGYQIWLGLPQGTERKYNDYTVKAYHSVPFLVEDVVYIDGFGGQRVYVVPSLELIIVRTGVSQTTWDDAVLVNSIVTAVNAVKGE
jgi:CubicO group peptidase (beta-lactamase class C family)